MKYSVSAYLSSNFTGLMNTLGTDDHNEVKDFIWQNVQMGYNCEITNNKTGKKQWAYADDFDEQAENPEDLIRKTKKTKRNSFYADLRMEQSEQM